jgi:uncharacterized cofD-like protein
MGMENRVKKITTIGGGTGNFTVLSGLKKHPTEISAIVNMSDDGGSTGILRHELGVLPPGDIRQCLVALSEAPDIMRDLFLYRFGVGGLSGHNFGNIFLSALSKLTTRFEDAVMVAGKILNIKGKVIPVSVEQMVLMAEYENKKVIKGQSKIGKYSKSPISRVYLESDVRGSYEAVQAILHSDVVVLAPGDIYTSLIPNFLPFGIVEALRRTNAKVVYVVNLMTKHGETHGFGAYDFVSVLEQYLGVGVIDYVFINTVMPGDEILALYAKENEYFVNPDLEKFESSRYKLVPQNFLSQIVFEQNPSDKLKRSLLRHDSDRIADAVMRLL